jgi:hypothetical protein
MVRTTLLLLAAIACAKAPPPPPYPAEALDASPRLPAPRAGSYARAVQVPSDPVVRALVDGRTWDASLAGAAAGLALAAATDSGGFSRRELREAAWQAGYPWPILGLGVWRTDEKGKPPPGLTAWLAAQPAQRDVGVVRARGQGRDVWVALSGEVQIALGVIPRELTLGHPLRLPARAGARWRASDGNGALTQGPLDDGATVPLETAGEWILQLFDDGGDLARFAVYVNDEAPRVGVLPVLDKPVNSPTEAEERAWELFGITRRAYGSPALRRDDLLDRALATSDAQDPPALAALGVRFARDPSRVVGWRCEAPTVEDCVDQLLWDPATRAPFVDPKAWSAAIDAQIAAGRVTVRGVAIAD